MLEHSSKTKNRKEKKDKGRAALKIPLNGRTEGMGAQGLRVRSRRTHQRRAILMGVVRQEVKRSAGRSGIMGSSSLASQAAS